MQIIVFVFVFLTVVVCCCRKEDSINDDDDYHHGDIFMMLYRGGSSRRSSRLNAGGDEIDGIDPKERRRHISNTIITKKVIESSGKQRRRSSELPSFSQRSFDSPKQSKSLPREYGSNMNDRVFSSFASAISKSQRIVKFASFIDEEIAPKIEEAKIEENDPVAETESSKSNNNTPQKQRPVRRKSNILARRLSWSLGTFGRENEPAGCNICLMDFEVGEEVGWSPNPDCVHSFHKECIVDWLMVKNECPICRRDYLHTHLNDRIESEEVTLNESSENIGSPQVVQV